MTNNNGACFWNVKKLVKKGEYLYAVVPEHPRANKHGYVLAHRIAAENKLERLLTPDEVVHHINGNKKDNRPENLEVTTNEEHASYHGRMKGRRTVILKCPNCGKVVEKKANRTHLNKKGEYTTCSRHCSGSFSRTIQLHGRTKAVQSAISANIIRDFTKIPNENAEETNNMGSVETIRRPPETVKT